MDVKPDIPFLISEKIDVKPDIIVRPSFGLMKDLEEGRVSKSVRVNLLEMALDPSITSVIVRLKKVQILNIHEPFYDKCGEIYLVTSVADGLAKKPLSVNINTFEGIKKNDLLDIGAPGVVIYENPAGKLPRYLDIRIQIVESDKGLRDTAEILKELNGNQGFKDIQKVLSTLATTANPLLGTVVGLTDEIIPLIGKLLGMNKDDQICYYAATFTDKFDNLGVGLHRHTKSNETEFSYEILGG